MEFLKLTTNILSGFMLFCIIFSYIVLRKAQKKAVEIPFIFFGGILIGYTVSKVFTSNILKDLIFIVCFIFTGVFMLCYSLKKYRQSGNASMIDKD
ncbi:MAG: hypothetical protein IKJ86_07465 [Clostridia bacterium]|nr:hypothetical protein [Clostridia bacterium]